MMIITCATVKSQVAWDFHGLWSSILWESLQWESIPMNGLTIPQYGPGSTCLNNQQGSKMIKPEN